MSAGLGPMKSLITGVTGFIGSHLAEWLLEAGEEVIGLSKRGVWPLGIEHLRERVPLVRADVADTRSLRGVLDAYRPRQIYHLAGQANVTRSFADPEGTWRTNFEGSRSLLNAVTEVVPRAKILFFSTGNIYGQPPESEMPIVEQTPPRPQTPYAISNAAADLLAQQYAADRKTEVVVVRPFNQIGPRQRLGYSIPDFAHQIARLERGGGPGELMVGDLSVCRDFTDVRDAVRAYHGLMLHGQAGEAFNVASGRTWSLEELVGKLVGQCRVPIQIRSDERLLRKFEPSVIRVAPDALAQKTGWRATIPMERTLADTLDYWRWRIAADRNDLTGDEPAA